MEHFVKAKTLFVLKRYDIANASIISPLILEFFTTKSNYIRYSSKADNYLWTESAC